MVFKPESLFLFISLIWLVVLSYLFLKFYLYYIRLAKNGQKKSLVSMLDEIVAKQKELNLDIELLNKRCDVIERNSLFHIQKVGLLRFNPFKDTGGDQSFILALLNGQNTGVVISSLHTRSGTRWFAKRVIDGKSVEYDLSEDERKALLQAQHGEKVVIN